MKRISKAASVLTVVMFFMVLLALAVVTTIREKETYSYYENRNLSAFPTATAESVNNGRYFSGIDTYIREHAAGRTTLLRVNTYVDMNVLKRPVVNDVVISGDVLLPYNEYTAVDRAQIAERAESAAQLLSSREAQVSSYGGKYYYVAVPSQNMCYEDLYPWYLNSGEEYSDAVSDLFFDALDRNGVPYIDMYSEYLKSGEPDYFMSTVDHHYTMLGAYDTYRAVMERVTADTDFSLPVLSDGNYRLEWLGNPFLGSRARKLFGLWTSDERLGLIYPSDSVTFERYNNGNRSVDLVYGFPWGDSVTPLLYSTYMGGDIANTFIDTHREELPTVLVYGDSFTNAFESIVWYSFDKMYSIDLRHYTEMTIDQFIDEYRPDIVICIKDYTAVLSGE